MIHHGECLEVMASMEPESVDAIVTDPPYGLEFMGKEWDRLGAIPERSSWGGDGRARAYGWHGSGRTDPARQQQWHARWAEAAYRVAKPSAYLLAFGGTRTVHRMTVALEDAGWIIRDMLVWGYASGFPKSKASLKPAWEPIVMARKPGPLRELAIDLCRIGMAEDDPTREWGEKYGGGRLNRRGEPYKTGMFGEGVGQVTGTVHPSGRWPANIILTDPIFDGGIEGVVGGGMTTTHSTGRNAPSDYEDKGVVGWRTSTTEPYSGDSGTYSRFFLVPKADRSDREPVLGGPSIVRSGHFAQPDGKRMGRSAEEGGGVREATPRANHHPTVKPTDLMRHLVRLVTPAGGTVLDCFAGSGTTALAAEQEGFQWIAIEREAEYVEIMRARLLGTQRGLGLALNDPPKPLEPTPLQRPAEDRVDLQLFLGVAGSAEGDEVA